MTPWRKTAGQKTKRSSRVTGARKAAERCNAVACTSRPAIESHVGVTAGMRSWTSERAKLGVRGQAFTMGVAKIAAIVLWRLTPWGEIVEMAMNELTSVIIPLLPQRHPVGGHRPGSGVIHCRAACYLPSEPLAVAVRRWGSTFRPPFHFVVPALQV